MAVPVFLAALLKSGMASLARASASGAIKRGAVRATTETLGAAARSKAMGFGVAGGLKHKAAAASVGGLGRGLGNVAHSRFMGPLGNRMSGSTAFGYAKGYSSGWGSTIADGMNSSVAGAAVFRGISGTATSQAGQFASSAGNQFVVDYASGQLVSVGVQALEQIDTRVGPTTEDDPHTMSPYDANMAAMNVSLHEEKSGLEQAIMFGAQALVSRGVSSSMAKFRKVPVSFDDINLDKGVMHQNPWDRTYQNTLTTMDYYKDRASPTAGRTVGTAAALMAMGASPEQVMQNMAGRAAFGAITKAPHLAMADNPQLKLFKQPTSWKKPPTVPKVRKVPTMNTKFKPIKGYGTNGNGNGQGKLF